MNVRLRTSAHLRHMTGARFVLALRDNGDQRLIARKVVPQELSFTP